MRMKGVDWRPFRVEFPILFGAENFVSLWVGMGWTELLWTVCVRLERIARARLAEGHGPMRIVQVKEKYGSLRIFLQAGTDEAENLIDEAETKSETICEACGAQGSNHTLRSGWSKTLCLFHLVETELNSGVKFEDIRKESDRDSDSWESLCISDPTMPRDPRLYLLDIVEAVAQITTYIGEMTRDAFQEHELTQEAVLYLVGVIGTASRQIPMEMIGPTPSSAWRFARGLRDHLAVERFGLDNDALWLAIKVDLPRLALEVERVLNSAER